MTATFPFAKPVCGCLAKRDGSIDMVSEANRINGNHGAGRYPRNSLTNVAGDRTEANSGGLPRQEAIAGYQQAARLRPEQPPEMVVTGIGGGVRVMPGFPPDAVERHIGQVLVNRSAEKSRKATRPASMASRMRQTGDLSSAVMRPLTSTFVSMTPGGGFKGPLPSGFLPRPSRWPVPRRGLFSCAPSLPASLPLAAF